MSAPDIGELLPASHVRAVSQGAVAPALAPVAMVLVIVIASVGIAYWSYVAHRDVALRLADDLIASLEQRIRTQVEGYLAPVARLADLSVNLLGSDAIDPGGEAATQAFALGVLASNRQIAIASYADPQGNFLMYTRQPSGAVDTKRIERDADSVRTSWIRRNGDGEVVKREVVDNDGYDPRVRPWYQGAVESGSLHWTDVYVFFTSGQPGITASLPVRGDDGQVREVHGLDITLESLNRFLAELRIGRRGMALIFEAGGQLVAFPDQGAMMRGDGQRLRTARIDEMADPVLERAYDRFRVEGDGRRVIEVDGVRYLNTVSSLATVVQRDWRMMVLVPEADFTGAVSSNFHTQLLVSLAVVAIATVLAGRVVKQGLNAQRDARRLASREATLERRGQALGQLTETAVALERDEAGAMPAFTETLCRTLDVDRVSVWRWNTSRTELVCEDAFDRRSGGHTDATRLKRASLPGLAGHLESPLAVLDATADPRLQGADRAFFEHLDVNSLLSVPVGDDGGVGVLWVEDRARGEDWADDVLPFLQGVARLLPGSIAAPHPDAPGQRTPPERITAIPAGPALHSADLVRTRARRLRRLVGGDADTDVFDRVSVLVMELDDPATWGRESPDDAPRSLMDTLVRTLQTLAAKQGVEYVKVLGTSVVCATGFDADAGGRDDEDAGGADAIAALALALEQHCGHALTRLGQGLSFRIGIDTGPVMGAGVGDEDWVYNIWGDAVSGAEAMARSCTPGTVQASEASYRILRDDHLFSPRGRYYVADRGETTTYVLLGQL